MNTRSFGSLLWLLLFGTATVLLIGAFARFDTAIPPEAADTNAPVATTPDTPAVTNFVPTPAPATGSTIGLNLPANLSPGLADVIKLAQSHVGDDTILTYIQNSGLNYNPSADELLYLTDIGVSEKVLAALLKKPEPPSAPAANPADPPVPAPVPGALAGVPEGMIDAPLPTDDQPAPLPNPQSSYFYDSLSPYGRWLDTGEGWAWQPAVAAADSGWMPYCNRGQWVLTDVGWYWASAYTWGWAPFHYGRWSRSERFGWIWVPGNVWAPAWVAWRNTEGLAGWAPLPPGVIYRPGVGLFTVSGRAGWNASYGINAELFTFVPREHFLARNMSHFASTGAAAAAVFKTSKPVNNYSVSGGRVLNAGISPEQIAAATKSPVSKMSVREVSLAGDAGVGGKGLAVYRPDVTAPATRPSWESGNRSILVNGARPATATPSRNTLNGGNFQAAESRSIPSSPAPAPDLAARPGAGTAGESRNLAMPREPAPAVNYPTLAPNQRGAAGEPPGAPTFRQGSAMPNYYGQRNAPGYGGNPAYGVPHDAQAADGSFSAPRNGAPPYVPPAQNRGGSANNSGGSAPTSNSSKTPK